MAGALGKLKKRARRRILSITAFSGFFSRTSELCQIVTSHPRKIPQTNQSMIDMRWAWVLDPGSKHEMAPTIAMRMMPTKNDRYFNVASGWVLWSVFEIATYWDKNNRLGIVPFVAQIGDWGVESQHEPSSCSLDDPSAALLHESVRNRSFHNVHPQPRRQFACSWYLVSSNNASDPERLAGPSG